MGKKEGVGEGRRGGFGADLPTNRHKSQSSGRIPSLAPRRCAQQAAHSRCDPRSVVLGPAGHAVLQSRSLPKPFWLFFLFGAGLSGPDQSFSMLLRRMHTPLALSSRPVSTWRLMQSFLELYKPL